MIYYKVYKIFGFIKRLGYDFKLGLSLKILFCSLVRLIFECGDILWDSHIFDNLSNRNGPKKIF